MKSGFTLVELLCVIVIIAIISLIAFPRVTKQINNSKEELYLTQVRSIEKQAENWALDNMSYLDKYHVNDTFITLDLLKEMKYLEKDTILNPKDKKEMNGCILISYKDNKYSYKYLDIDCTLSNQDLSEYSDSYVIYEYDDESFEINKITSKENIPAYQVILNNNPINVLGETENGLYDLENEYVFRGSEVNNFVKYDNKVWRILSIDKHDYSMKLISNSLISSIMSSPEEIDFTKTELYGTLSDNVVNYTNLKDIWNNGLVLNSSNNIFELERILKSNEITSKVGLISIYDYVVASTNSECENDFKSLSCKQNNYIANLYENKNFWTMNNDGNGIWYFDANEGFKTTSSTSGPYYYSMVIKVPINSYFINSENKTGSSIDNAYILK